MKFIAYLLVLLVLGYFVMPSATLADWAFWLFGSMLLANGLQTFTAT